MNCPEQPYSKTQIRSAGEFIRSGDWSDFARMTESLNVLAALRTAHAAHLDNFNAFVRMKLKREGYKGTIVAQRLKRFNSIADKLRRFDTMGLERMQDIAGIRIIFRTKEDVLSFYHRIMKTHGRREALKPHDYIEHPKPDGYRSIHAVFKCFNRKCPQLDGMKVELQMRTALQHMWATAVETLGLITETSIKTGRGAADHKEYLCLISALFAMEENANVPEHLSGKSRDEIIRLLREVDCRAHVTETLFEAAKKAVKIVGGSNTKNAKYSIIKLDTEMSRVSITNFENGQTDDANAIYKDLERNSLDQHNMNIVLVSVDASKNLKKAYPNFFMDTKKFVEKVKGYLS